MKPLSDNSEYYTKDRYLVSVDLEQKKNYAIEGVNGEKIDLLIESDYNPNHRVSHPNYAVIRYASENAQFKVGQEIICHHFAFQDKDRKSYPNTKDNDGTDLYSVDNFKVYFGIQDGELVCREGVLLCEPVKGKLIKTTLELTSKYDNVRRDIAKVMKVWEGCEDIKSGDYVLLNKGGDYVFTFKDNDYIKCDTYFDDILAVVDSEDWRLSELREHAQFGEVQK